MPARWKWLDLKKLPRLVRWILLIILTLCLSGFLEIFAIPGALLLGPMIAAILIAVSNGDVKISNPIFQMAQGLVGCLMAHAITTDILKEVATDWPLFICGVISVIIIAMGIGYILAKKQVLPGTTAIWGSSPGAAATMVIMAQDFGSDERLVAVMQYLRVALVAGLASILAHFLAPTDPHAVPIEWFPAVDMKWLLATVVLAFGGALISKQLRIPAGGVLLPFVLGIILQNTGLMTIVLPQWLLSLSYLVIGWTIGLRFTRTILVHTIKALPILFACTILLIGLCTILAFAMSYFHHVDLLTAYLATSPGGADSVAIIAASTAVNVPFVMSFQATRFIIVTLTGPLIARWLAKRIGLPPETPRL